MQKGYKYQLKFYSTRKDDYRNKLFCWNLKSEKEAFSLLYLFALHHNIFHKIYLKDLSTKHQFVIGNEELKEFNLHPESILEYKRCLC